MSTHTPKAPRRWLVNYWRDSKIVHSLKVEAPTKFLAVLAVRWHPHDNHVDRRTITPMKTTRRQ